MTIWADVDATGLLARRASRGAGLLALLAPGPVSPGSPSSRSSTPASTATGGRSSASPRVHLGFAAQTPKGLVVPVVRDADRLSLDDLAAELRRLRDLARQDALPVGHRTGGTFTLDNYGVLDVDGATPILNHPQVAMVGVGRVLDLPWAVDGRVEVRKVVTLSLTFDHRVCDGGTAAGFLRHVVDAVEAGGGDAR
ncbi:pyruvate/2-oxoglutarate dehydrogenase complex dihydrolipoamide acyltransferase (E2) component [Streptomyces sp. SAI-126]|uniref:2-oxo acid dehydrogenase subunit E2 n=1 Tax=Streptomyces sp. SAI-126 TaxID=3377732 RepID=UPI003C7D1F34